jgi:hypothetical protein
LPVQKPVCEAVLLPRGRLFAPVTVPRAQTDATSAIIQSEEALSNAVLGKAVNDALAQLIDAGRVDRGRVLAGFPHPSGLNGHRVPQFVERKTTLSAQVEQWARNGTTT